MSLDVYLKVNGSVVPPREKIFVRSGGSTKEITREEWDERNPGREPVMLLDDGSSGNVFTANITHNLNNMAAAAGIYKELWRPEEIGITKAEQLIEPLTFGLARLKADPEEYKKFDPANNWGNYDQLVDFVERYLEAAKANPTADVLASR